MGMPRKIKDSDIIELYGEGLNDTIIGEILGCSSQLINRRRNALGLPKNKARRRDSKIYAVYLRDTTEFLFEGTIKEISSYLGRSESTLRSYLCRQKKGQKPYYEFVEVEQ